VTENAAILRARFCGEKVVNRSTTTVDGPAVPPFLRWAGSKRAAIPILRQFIPPVFNKYIEPFAGSACLFFHVQPEKAILADLNSELIDMYAAVKKSPGYVARALVSLPFGRDEYYQIRQKHPSDLSPTQKAARFIYLNRFCFNGLYRTNAAGTFNVPFGAPRNASVPTVSHLKQCSSLLQNAKLLAGDFEKAVSSNVSTGDFVYLDPPFFQTEGRVFRQYNSKPFMKQDLERLRKLLDRIDSVGATFLLSYAKNREADELLRGWHSKTITLQRNISGFAGARGKATEIVVSNKPLVAR
jgi:DNA adenine methylase